MTRVVVVGSGGLGREVIDVLAATERMGGPRFVGVLDDHPPPAWIGPHLGPVSGSNVPLGASVVIAVGDPETRLRLVSRLGGGIDYANVIHPTAVVSDRASLGRGIFAAPYSYVGFGSVVGDHVVLNVYASLGHDTTAGDAVVLSPYATLNGHAIVGQGCFLGTRAIVGVGHSVGAWSKIATGSSVTTDLGIGTLAIGNPAKGRVMFREPEIDLASLPTSPDQLS